MSPMIAVIGAGYGDEGKGLATDFFAHTTKISGLVARGNGGAQAGHTVTTPSGHRHVFGHLGAGSFALAPTYLAADFILNPLILRDEINRFQLHSAVTPIYASDSCRVTTVYDMAINAILEISRGKNRHGSCGMGINETVTRHNAGYTLTLKQLREFDQVRLGYVIAHIQNDWVKKRLQELNLFKEDLPEAEMYFNVLEADNSLKIAGELIEIVDQHIKKQLPPDDCDVVYEGAQGLLLDEFHGVFPHVTRSITGVASAIKAGSELGQKQIQPVYMTRCYVTRHGAGPLAHDGDRFGENSVIDQTNVDNKWQGSIRYAPLDLLVLRKAIAADLLRAKHVAQVFGVEVLPPKIAVTCLDQVGSWVKLISEHGGFSITLPPDEAASYIARSVGCELAFESWGPTRNDVRTPKTVV